MEVVLIPHKLGPDDSALAVLIKEADWAAVDEKMDPFGGEGLGKDGGIHLCHGVNL